MKKSISNKLRQPSEVRYRRKKEMLFEALWRVLLGTKAVARLAMLDDLEQEYQATTAVEGMFPKIKQGSLSDSSKQAYNKNKYWWMRKL